MQMRETERVRDRLIKELQKNWEHKERINERKGKRGR